MSSVCDDVQCPLDWMSCCDVPFAMRCVAVAPLIECDLKMVVSIPVWVMMVSALFASRSVERHFDMSLRYRKGNIAG